MNALLTNRVWGAACSPVSALYRSIVHVRNSLYNCGTLHALSLGTPVISIGNISAGGTGKTPLVEFTARLLLNRGISPLVISRGYKRKSTGILTVHDGKRFQAASSEISGDEPWLIASLLGNVPVIVGEDRYKAGIYAEKRFSPDVIILDDGFQHRRLDRDLDIVVVDATNPWGNGFMLPGGPLREPVSALGRAGLVVLSRVNEAPGIGPTAAVITQHTSAPVCLSRYIPGSWSGLGDEKLDTGALKNSPVFAFTATGNPLSFKKTLITAGCDVRGFKSFPDHHWFTSEEFNRLAQAAHQTGSQCLVTTEKDMVRLAGFTPGPVPVYSLRISVDIFDGMNYFVKKAEDCIASA